MNDNGLSPRERMERGARTERRNKAVRDAAALRLVGAAVAVAAKARRMSQWPFGTKRFYEVPEADMDRLIEAAREAGFKV